jgi:uncharacterized protein (DUF1330 family)
MPAYLIVDCEVTDPERYEVLQKARPARDREIRRALSGPRRRYDAARRQLAAQAGRGARVSDEEAAKRFYASPEYSAARVKRAGAANMNMVLVPGVSA